MVVSVVQSAVVVQSVTAAQQFAVPDLLPVSLLSRVLLAKLVYNGSRLASPQAGKLMSVGRLKNPTKIQVQFFLNIADVFLVLGFI
jgi:hypothetical protein